MISDNEEYIRKARFLATQARDKAPHYQHSEIGYNYRMSNIVAGIGRGQMEVVEERVKKRRENFDFYKSILSGIRGISFIEEPGPEYFSNRWLTTILIEPENTGRSREEVRLALEMENIESRPLWKPMHMQPVFGNYPSFVNGISERLFDKGLCLPSGSNMTNDEKERIALARIMESENVRNRVYQKFNPEVIKKVTGITEDSEIIEFMVFCDFADQYVLDVNEYTLMEQIALRYEQFKRKKKAEQSGENPVNLKDDLNNPNG